MAEFLRTEAMPPTTLAANSTTDVDLPINPLSHLVLRVVAVLADADVAGLHKVVMDYLTNIQVTWRGQTIYQSTGEECGFQMNAIVGVPPTPYVRSQTDANNLEFALVVPFGRALLVSNEGLPATQRGELQLRLQTGALPATLTSVSVSVETVQMLGVQPAYWLKQSRLAATPAVTGDFDLALPIGNLLAGLHLWGTTVPVDAASTSTINAVTLLLDNVQRYIGFARWGALWSDTLYRYVDSPLMPSTRVMTDMAAAYTQFQVSGDHTRGESGMQNHRYVDFDPNRDAEWLLDSAGLSQFVLRVNVGVANALVVRPVELVPASALGV
jgi:hypothetical protein